MENNDSTRIDSGKARAYVDGMSTVYIGKKLFLSSLVQTVQVGSLSTFQPKEKDTLMKMLMNLEDNSLDDNISFDSTEGSQEPEEETEEEEENKELKEKILRLRR